MEAVSEQEILLWLEELFEASPGSININSQREDIEAWDSLGTLTLMAELDQRFDIALSEDALENFSSVTAVIDLIRQKGLLK
ncbi:hypothetical protein NBRC116493_14860 [Aurantivibrio infirmus]